MYLTNGTSNHFTDHLAHLHPRSPCMRARARACTRTRTRTRTHTHTHTHLTDLRPRLPRWAGIRKVKPIWILLKQKTVSGSEIRWAICKSAPRSRQITMPAPHRSVFLQAGCSSCHPTNSVKALKTCIIWQKSILWLGALLITVTVHITAP